MNRSFIGGGEEKEMRLRDERVDLAGKKIKELGNDGDEGIEIRTSRREQWSNRTRMGMAGEEDII